MSRVYDIVELDKNRGRGGYLNCDIPAGTVVAKGPSTLNYPNKKYESNTCHYCMKFEGNCPAISCADCNIKHYCSHKCCRADHKHHSVVCNAYNALKKVSIDLDNETYSIICFVIEVIALKLSNEVIKYNQVLAQANTGITLTKEEKLACHMALDLIVSSIHDDRMLDFCNILWVEDVVAKDKCCGFAIMLPCQQRFSDNLMNEDGDVEIADCIRGFSSFPQLALFNHSCLPTVARWDRDGTHGEEKLTACYRALYDLPAGTEITLSYVPLEWNFRERQDYLFEEYGFRCDCDRCLIESQYESDDGINTNNNNDLDMDSMEYQEAMESMEIEKASKTNAFGPAATSTKSAAVDDTYVGLYLCRHMCTTDDCTGTLTPSIGFQVENPDTSYYECNVCNLRRSHEEFMEILMNNEEDEEEDDWEDM